MTDEGRARRPLRPALLAALIISLSITIGSLLFIVWRIASPPATVGINAFVDSDSWFDGATIIEPPRTLTTFTLAGNDGLPLSLGDLAGKATLLVFGYTRCPDYCPLTLADFTLVKAALGARASDG